MKVLDLINELERLKQELKDKEIMVYSPNGLLSPAEIKFKLKNEKNIWDKSEENVECIVLS